MSKYQILKNNNCNGGGGESAGGSSTLLLVFDNNNTKNLISEGEQEEKQQQRQQLSTKPTLFVNHDVQLYNNTIVNDTLLNERYSDVNRRRQQFNGNLHDLHNPAKLIGFKNNIHQYNNNNNDNNKNNNQINLNNNSISYNSNNNDNNSVVQQFHLKSNNVSGNYKESNSRNISNNNNKTINSNEADDASFMIVALNADDNAPFNAPVIQEDELIQNVSPAAATAVLTLNGRDHYNNNNNIDNDYDKQDERQSRSPPYLCQQRRCEMNSKCDSTTHRAKRKILWAIVMCSVFMIIEFVGGYISGSLAIMTDAAHLVSDCIGFIIALIAIWLGDRPPDARMSFGYKRFEVIGAVASILCIWLLTGILAFTAIQRIWRNQYDLDANTMMFISLIGIFINIIMICMLHSSPSTTAAGCTFDIGLAHSHGVSHNNHQHYVNTACDHYETPTKTTTNFLAKFPCFQHHKSSSDYYPLATASLPFSPADIDETSASADKLLQQAGCKSQQHLEVLHDDSRSKHQHQRFDKNLNLRAAVVHVIGDLLQSTGVFLSSAIIKFYPSAVILDPLCTLLFSAIVIMTTMNVFKESMGILIDRVPANISIDELKSDFLHLDGVKFVHDLNIWNHATGHSILMVHLVIDALADEQVILKRATNLVQNSNKYFIKQSCIQIERLGAN